MASKKGSKPMTPRIEVFDGLTVEEARFCAGYAGHGDRTRALKESGYGFSSDTSAYDRARELLRSPGVQKELKRQVRKLTPDDFLSDDAKEGLATAKDLMGSAQSKYHKNTLRLLNGLTLREQQFCNLVAGGKTAKDAYVGAGYRTIGEANIGANASRLVKKEAVKEEIESQIRAMTVAGSISRDKVLNGIFEHTKSENENTALKAWELLGKSVGLFVEDKAVAGAGFNINLTMGSTPAGVVIEGEKVGG
ncbi:MAG: hypothetical protein HN344_03315 [Gammaproteobacteria bacterium]|nr:hypothetical protein [Gammaproteobacteria bacterium]